MSAAAAHVLSARMAVLSNSSASVDAAVVRNVLRAAETRSRNVLPSSSARRNSRRPSHRKPRGSGPDVLAGVAVAIAEKSPLRI